MDNNLNSSATPPVGGSTEPKAWFLALVIIILFLIIIFIAAIWSSREFGSSEELSEKDKLEILKRLDQGGDSTELSEAEKLDILKRLQ